MPSPFRSLRHELVDTFEWVVRELRLALALAHDRAAEEREQQCGMRAGEGNGAVMQAWATVIGSVEDRLRAQLSALPLETSSDNAALLDMLRSIAMGDTRTLHVTAPSATSSSLVDDKQLLELQRGELGQIRLEVCRAAAMVQQRVMELEAQLRTATTMLELAHAKNRRRAGIVRYIQATLYKEVVLLHEQLAIALELSADERARLLDSGFVSFMDFLQLVEDEYFTPDELAADAPTALRQRLGNASSFGITEVGSHGFAVVQHGASAAPKLPASGSGGLGGCLSLRERLAGAPIEAVLEMLEKWRREALLDDAEREPGAPGSSTRAAMAQDLARKADDMERTMRTMSERFASEASKLRAGRVSQERRVVQLQRELLKAADQLTRLDGQVEDQQAEITSLEARNHELQCQLELQRLTADSAEVDNQSLLSAQDAKLAAERRRINKVLAKIISGNYSSLQDVRQAFEEADDDPSTVDFLRGLEDLKGADDQVAMLQEQLGDANSRLAIAVDRRGWAENITELAARQLREVGLPYDSHLAEFLVDKYGESALQRTPEDQAKLEEHLRRQKAADHLALLVAHLGADLAGIQGVACKLAAVVNPDGAGHDDAREPNKERTEPAAEAAPTTSGALDPFGPPTPLPLAAASKGAAESPRAGDVPPHRDRRKSRVLRRKMSSSLRRGHHSLPARHKATQPTEPGAADAGDVAVGPGCHASNPLASNGPLNISGAESHSTADHLEATVTSVTTTDDGREEVEGLIAAFADARQTLNGLATAAVDKIKVDERYTQKILGDLQLKQKMLASTQQMHRSATEQLDKLKRRLNATPTSPAQEGREADDWSELLGQLRANEEGVGGRTPPPSQECSVGSPMRDGSIKPTGSPAQLFSPASPELAPPTANASSPMRPAVVATCDAATDPPFSAPLRDSSAQTQSPATTKIGDEGGASATARGEEEEKKKREEEGCGGGSVSSSRAHAPEEEPCDRALRAKHFFAEHEVSVCTQTDVAAETADGPDTPDDDRAPAVACPRADLQAELLEAERLVVEYMAALDPPRDSSQGPDLPRRFQRRSFGHVPGAREVQQRVVCGSCGISMPMSTLSLVAHAAASTQTSSCGDPPTTAATAAARDGAGHTSQAIPARGVGVSVQTLLRGPQPTFASHGSALPASSQPLPVPSSSSCEVGVQVPDSAPGGQWELLAAPDRGDGLGDVVLATRHVVDDAARRQRLGSAGRIRPARDGRRYGTNGDGAHEVIAHDDWTTETLPSAVRPHTAMREMPLSASSCGQHARRQLFLSSAAATGGGSGAPLPEVRLGLPPCGRRPLGNTILPEGGTSAAERRAIRATSGGAIRKVTIPRPRSSLAAAEGRVRTRRPHSSSASAALRRTQSPPPPMYHAHLPGDGVPSIGPPVRVDVDSVTGDEIFPFDAQCALVASAFEADFGVDLATAKAARERVSGLADEAAAESASTLQRRDDDGGGPSVLGVRLFPRPRESAPDGSAKAPDPEV